MTIDEALKAAGGDLRRAREALGLTQETVSFSTGIDQSTLSKVEREGPQIISWRKLLKLMRELDCGLRIDRGRVD